MRGIPLLFLLIFLLAHIVNGEKITPKEEEIQLSIMKALFHKTSGEGWTRSTNWNTNKTCEFYGVKCDSEEFVVEIVLPNNNLTGVINSLLPSLKRLQRLDLSRNELEGSIPSGGFESLVVLDLSANNLGGDIPYEFRYSTNLVDVDLSWNGLSGAWDFFGIMSKLESLDLSHNLFVGFPNRMNCKALTDINLSYNNLNTKIRPRAFESCVQLKWIYLTDCGLKGTLWNFKPLISLVAVFVDNNAIEGRVPKEVAQLARLEVFNLKNNRLNGTLPSHWPSKNLTNLVLGNNRLEGPLPTTFGATSLRRLELFENRFNGSVPKWGNLPFLFSLDLHGNLLSGQIPSIPSQIMHLNLSNNLFDGADLAFDSNFKFVEKLDLSNNRLKFVNMTNLSSMHSLIHLNLSNNQISGTLPFFGKMPNLQKVDMSHNEFIGSIPNSVRIVGLTHLDLSHNQLKGSLPQLGQNSLDYLDLSHNQLTGVIPVTFSSLRGLTHCDLSQNFLDFLIPNRFVEIDSISYLDLSNNELGGSLAEQEFSRNLKYFNVSNNRFDGGVPVSLLNSPFLEFLDLSHNNFSFYLPSINTPNLVTFKLNNNKLIGGINGIEKLLRLEVLDLSLNQFMSEIGSTLPSTSLKYLNISHNQFTGGLPYFWRQNQIEILDANSNQLNGELFSSIPSTLTHLDLSHNLLTGNVPTFPNSMKLLDLSDNRLLGFEEREFKSDPKHCSMDSNTFVCPIPWRSISLCNANCSISDRSNVTFRMILQGSFKSFIPNLFIEELSDMLNISSPRVFINSMREGSIVLDLMIGPPIGPVNEGSAAYVLNEIKRIHVSSPDLFMQRLNYSVSYIGKEPEESSASWILPLSLTAIFVLLVISIVVIVKKWWKKRLLGKKKQDSIDTKYIINFEELEAGLKLVGKGVFGVVYRSTWRELTVAVKQVRKEMITEQTLADFLGEGKILHELRPHPNVVLFLGLTLSPLSIVTEFCERGSLYSYLRCHDVSFEQKGKFLYGIALGMHHLHEEKVIHRDLAVRNILLTRHLEPKVSDFGLSRVQKEVDSTSRHASFIGPVKWLAPECIRNGEYSKKTDIWSFGVVVWEVLTVQDPFPNMSAEQVAIGVTSERLHLPVPVGTDAALTELMAECWSHSPEDRPDFRTIHNLISNMNFVQLDSPTNDEEQEMAPLITSTRMSTDYHEFSSFPLNMTP